MSTNITIAARKGTNGNEYDWENGRKVLYITATGSSTQVDDEGSYTVTQMQNPSHAIIPGCSVSVTNKSIAVLAEVGLGSAVVHGAIYSTPGDV